jgi:hypothetical protein
VKALPQGARLHLVTHSRGGLVAEVLESARVEARMVQQRQEAERARAALARIIKRRRDDELLLLMD